MANKQHKFTKKKNRRKNKYEESVITVPCTRRIQRIILHNLYKAAHSNIYFDHSARAAELLAKIEAESKKTTDKVKQHITAKTPVEITLPVKDVVRSRAQRVWLSINTAFKNYTGSISSFIKQKLLFRAAPGG